MSIWAYSTGWACVCVQRVAANFCHIMDHGLVHPRHPSCTWIGGVGLEMDVFDDEAASDTNLQCNACWRQLFPVYRQQSVYLPHMKHGCQRAIERERAFTLVKEPLVCRHWTPFSELVKN